MTFADYFLSMKGGTEPWLVFIVGVGAGVIGMICHWFKKAVKDETGSSLWQWFLVSNIKGSILSFCATVSGIIAVFMPMPVESTTLWAALTTGWAVGYASDSISNSDKTQSESSPSGDSGANDGGSQ